MPDREHPAAALRTAVVWSRWLVLATIVVAAGPMIGLPGPSPQAVLIIAAVGLLAGLPHGGIDHLLAMRLTGKPIVLVVVGYAGVAACAWGLLQWAGPVALAVVVALSALHFGLGELEVTREVTGWHPGRLTAAAVVVAGSGALLLPLARSGDQFNAVATAVSPGLAELIAMAPVRTGVLIAWLVAAAVAVTAALMAGQRSTAGDIVLIGALGMLAPPLLAFAVWFGGWHSLRHLARMLTRDPDCAALLDLGRRRAAGLRLARLAAPMTLAALLTVVALGWVTVTAPDPTAVMAAVLRLLLALTVPHMLVVMWLDTRREALQPA